MEESEKTTVELPKTTLTVSKFEWWLVRAVAAGVIGFFGWLGGWVIPEFQNVVVDVAVIRSQLKSVPPDEMKQTVEANHSEVKQELQNIRYDLSKLTVDRIYRVEFQKWLLLFEKANPDLTVPSLPNKENSR